MHDRAYEEIPAGNEEKFIAVLAKQISEVYRHKCNLPPELKLDEAEEVFRDSLQKHHASPELAFIHTLHRRIVAATQNNTYLDGEHIYGVSGTDWKKLAKELHQFITENASELNKQPAQSQGFFLSVDPVKFASDTVNSAIKKINTADRKFEKTLSLGQEGEAQRSAPTRNST
ncbi:MAG: hypothetical protein SFW66_10985 [Gammaproteobacteria bacterium]|nr:hypothetical protein [Gammaproteobacteria bacterium]